MIRKIIFCLILLCCISPIAFAETISDNINETIDNDTLINNTDDSNLEISNTPYNVRITDDGRIRLDFNFSERFNELKRVSTGGDKYNLTEIYSELAKLHPKPVIDYTDTYVPDAMTGKFYPVGKVTKPVPEDQVEKIPSFNLNKDGTVPVGDYLYRWNDVQRTWLPITFKI